MISLTVKTAAPSIDFTPKLDLFVDLLVSGACEPPTSALVYKREVSAASTATATAPVPVDISSPVAASPAASGPVIFDGSQPEIYLEWRFLVLSKIPLSELGSRTAAHVLLDAAPFLEVRNFVKKSNSMNPASLFHAVLWYLDSRFDNAVSEQYIRDALLSERERERLARLKNIQALFLAPTGGRAAIRAFIDAFPSESQRDLARVLYGFGDTNLTIFKARLKAFTLCISTN